MQRPWNYHSGVNRCATCEGEGAVWNGKGRGGNDPDSFDIECDDCEGVGHFACQVCGFDVPTSSYDCVVCDTVESLDADELECLLDGKIGEAFASAAQAVLKFRLAA